METDPISSGRQKEPLFDIYLRGRPDSGSMEPHVHFYHQILLITSGRAHFVIGSKEYEASRRSFLIISAFERHELNVTEYPYDGYVLAVNNEFVRRYLTRPYLNQAFWCRPEGVSHMVELSEAAFSRAVSLCGQMVEELREGRPLWDEQEAACTMELMTLVYRESPDSYWKPFDTRARELIYEAQRYVADHYAENIGLESLAASLYVSKYYLSHLFRQETGYSYREYLLQYRLSAARQLLLETRLSMSEVAAACGWENPGQFTRAFRKYEGCTPREYQMR